MMPLLRRLGPGRWTAARLVTSPVGAQPRGLSAGPRAVTDFSSPIFWDDFYRERRVPSRGSGFEWFVDSERALGAIDPVVSATPSWRQGTALHVGSGTSSLGLALVELGLATSVVNTDRSERAIRQMRRASGSLGCQEWVVDDCCASHLASGSFALIVDKGTMDAVGFGEGGAARCEAMAGEMARLLVPGGVFLQVPNNYQRALGLHCTAVQFLRLVNTPSKHASWR